MQDNKHMLSQQSPIPVSAVPLPSGLQYLTQVDQLLIHQQVDMVEALIGFEQNNRYEIKNSLGQLAYFAVEETDVCMRMMCGSLRGFTIRILDNFQQEVIRVKREFRCCVGCHWCANSASCSMFVTVESPVGVKIATIRQRKSCYGPHYIVEDDRDNTVFAIRGPNCLCQTVCCRSDINIDIMTPNEEHSIGKIAKQWGGFFQEAFTKASNFSVAFPMDLSVQMKAALLGAAFLIDFMYFENDDK